MGNFKMSATTFEEAVDLVNNKMNKTLSNDELKEIYALYKQATVGDINVDRPGMMSMDFKGKAKKVCLRMTPRPSIWNMPTKWWASTELVLKNIPNAFVDDNQTINIMIYVFLL